MSKQQTMGVTPGTARDEALDRFNRNVGSPDYPVVGNVACLCGATRAVPLVSRDRYGLWGPVVLCATCGLIYARPRLTSEGYRRFYESDMYRRLYDGEDYARSLGQCYSPERGRHILELIRPHLNGRGLRTILEVGCGGGWNLLSFLEAGYPAVGYDLSPAMAALGRSKGLDVRQGGIEDIKERYDCIVVNHVIEHFSDFYGSMGGLVRLLRPGGLLYVGVPDMDNFWQSQFQNVHLYYFTRRTLVCYLLRCGLRPLALGRTGNHFHGLFETAIADPGACPPRTEFPRMLLRYGRYRALRLARRLLGRRGRPGAP